MSGSGEAAQATPSSQRPDIEAHVATVNSLLRPTPTPTKVDPSDEKTKWETAFNDGGKEPQCMPVSVSNVDTIPDLRDGAIRSRASKSADEIATPLEEAHRVRRFVVDHTFGAETLLPDHHA